MKGKSKEQIKTEIDARAKTRAEAQKQIVELAKKRADYLKDHAKDADGFDAKVKSTVDRELSK